MSEPIVYKVEIIGPGYTSTIAEYVTSSAVEPGDTIEVHALDAPIYEGGVPAMESVRVIAVDHEKRIIRANPV
jgi:hypothetical protein